MNTISLADKIKIYEHLKTCINQDQNTIRYVNGIDDQAIARTMSKLLGKEVSKNNIRGIRLEMFGKFTQRSKPRKGNLAERVTTVEARLTAIEEQLGVRYEVQSE